MIVHAISLPADIERGAEFGPEWSTTLDESDNGGETTNANWVYPRHSGDIQYGIQTIADLRPVQTFFMGRRGRAYGFLFKDWFDYTLTVEAIGIGDGVNLVFQVTKNYPDAILPLLRRITRPTSPLSVFVDGVLKTAGSHYNINYATGVITFTGGNAPPNTKVVTVTGEFSVPVRFDTDRLPIILTHAAGEGAVQTGSIPIIEVKE